MPYVFGDSYGGVQAAQQAATNSDRSFLESLLAAQQRAQQMAMEQSTYQNQLARQPFEDFMRSRQLALQERNAENELAQREEDRKLREELGWAGIGASEDKIQAIKDNFDKRLQATVGEHLKEVESAGPSAAQNYAEKIQALQDSTGEEQSAMDAWQKAQATVNRMVQEQHLSEKKMPDGSVIYRATDPDVSGDSASQITSDISSKIRAVNEAKQKRLEAEKELHHFTDFLMRQGFQPDDANQVLISPKTQQVFPYADYFKKRVPIPSPVQNSPQILQWNPKTGFGNSAVPAAQPKVVQPAVLPTPAFGLSVQDYFP